MCRVHFKNQNCLLKIVVFYCLTLEATMNYVYQIEGEKQTILRRHVPAEMYK